VLGLGAAFLAGRSGLRTVPHRVVFLSIPVPVFYVLGLYGGLRLVVWSSFGSSARRGKEPASEPTRSP
jgi:hypothetical protein